MDSDDCRIRPSSKDDAINGRFRVTWQIFLKNNMDNSPVNNGISWENNTREGYGNCSLLILTAILSS
jgi:hypothetical protein